MKSIDEAEAHARLDEVLDETQQYPIVIQRRGQDVAVILSMASYEQLRTGVVQAFLAIRNDVARDASAAGLTEGLLTDLLSDEQTLDPRRTSKSTR